MSNLATNVISNILGAGWLAVVQLVLVPLYVRLLGIEAYGLVGFYVTLQGVLKILEFGLSPTINRELARYSVRPDLAGEANDFTRTFELICWVMAAIIAIGVYLLAPWIAFRWLRGGSIPHETLLNSVRCMGLLAALQWPLTFYQSGLLGLQRQALLNITKSLMVTFTGLAGIAVLVQWERSIVLFFGSQVAATFLHVVTARTLLWRYLPASARRPGISLTRFAGVYRFAAGVSGITVCSLVITQADKVVLSKVLTLEQFGYYSLATVIATGFTAMNAPLFQALFPRFTALIAAGQEGAVRPLFRRRRDSRHSGDFAVRVRDRPGLDGQSDDRQQCQSSGYRHHPGQRLEQSHDLALRPATLAWTDADRARTEPRLCHLHRSGPAVRR
jgi:O-antigen/teichoic acid export membrane protein